MKQIVVIVNKKWEAAPILNVFRAPYSSSTHASARPYEWIPGEPYPSPQMWPDSSSTYNFEYRYVLSPSTCRIEFWCLADFADVSDSGVKSTFIPKILAGGLPDLVIAAGTAASPQPHLQGSVMVGCRSFMHDPKLNPPPPQSDWPADLLDKFLESTFSPTFSRLIPNISSALPIEIRRRLLAPVAPGGQAQLKMNPELTTLADVNVKDYTMYKVADPQTVDACKRIDQHAQIASVDTTLALIRAKTDPSPFLFMSGISNELGFLNRDVNDTEYAGNFVASHNIGVVLAWMLPLLASL